MNLPDFDVSVPPHGYRWWYVDAISDSGDQALTLIAFIGSVFSPYYKHAREHGSTRPENHCAINMALYGPGGRWCMTERDRSCLHRTPDVLTIGPSHLRRSNDELICTVNEWGFPLPRRVRGRLRISIANDDLAPLSLHEEQTHLWQPIAPCTEIEVDFEHPHWQWKGSAYVDSNWGASPLESDFRTWQWSRSHLADGSTLIQYDTQPRRGQRHQHTLHVGGNRRPSGPLTVNQPCQLPGTRYWRIPRSTRLDAGASVCSLATLEDTPFYARSRFDTTLDGLHARCIHESLDLDRFNRQWVRCLLPFRMPRYTRGSDRAVPVVS